MRQAALAAFLLACGPAPAPPAPVPIAPVLTPTEVKEEPPVTFTRGGATVGSRCTRHSAQQLTLHVELGRKVIDIQDDRNRKIGVEVLAVADGASIEQRVTYQVAVRRKVQNGEGASLPEPVQGKTYLVALGDGATAITDLAGAPIPEDEREMVANDHPLFGERDAIQAGMPEHELHPGDRVPGLEAAIERDFEARAEKEPGAEGVSISGVEVTYQKRRDDTGIFAVRVLWRHNDPESIALTIPFEGSLEVRISDAQPLLLDLEGVVGVAAPDGTPPRDANVKGRGKMSMKLRYTCP